MNGPRGFRLKRAHIAYGYDMGTCTRYSAATDGFGRNHDDDNIVGIIIKSVLPASKCSLRPCGVIAGNKRRRRAKSIYDIIL